MRTVVLLFLGILSSVAQPVAWAAISEEPIKIGFITSLSSIAGDSGHEMVEGVELYLDEINHEMGGRPVKLLVENDQSSPAGAVAGVNKLIAQDKVQVLDGFLLSNIASAACPFVEKQQIPTIVALASSDELTQRFHFHWIVRTGWSASQGTLPLGEWVYKNLHYKKVATFGLELPMAWESIGGFQKSFEGAGGQVIQKSWAPMGFTDFTDYMKNLRRDADAVFIAGVVKGSALVLDAYRKSGPKLPVIATKSTYDDSVLQKFGDSEVGSLTVSNWTLTLDNAFNKRFVKAYIARYHHTPSIYAEAGYTSVMWIKSAVDAVNGDVENKARFLAALKKVELSETPRGPMKLDDYGNPIQNVYVCKIEKNKSGKLESDVIYTFKNVSQFGPFKPDDYLKEPPFSKTYPPCKFCTPAK
jgi:branched-chain amino acid transport system substrate-binding protein